MRTLFGCVLVSTVCAAAQPALAQSPSTHRPYVGASFGSFDIRADDLDGKSFATGILAGIAVSRLIDVEIDVQFPTKTFTRSYVGVLESLAPPGSSIAEIERLSVHTRVEKQRDVSANVSVVAVIHPPRPSRVVPGFVVGVANQRSHNRTIYTPVRIPEGLDPQHRAARPGEERATRNIGGPTIGGNVAIAITRQLWVVPDVRYDYGSIGDEINNALRTSVRMVWKF
jgi:hypothetical protein